MGWFLVFLVWWCGTSAIPSPSKEDENWKCPKIFKQPFVECSCDIPHTLRCVGDKTALSIITNNLRSPNTPSVSLLDCTVQNVSTLNGHLFEGVSLHGLVVSSGEINEVNSNAFHGLSTPLQALGLPNNQLTSVPILALEYLPELDRLDLSGNKLKTLDINSFKGLRNLSFIDVSNNAITKISPNTFTKLPNLKILRLRGNRLKFSIIRLNPIPAIEEIDLSENLLIGPLGPKTFPKMDSLKNLQLSHNLISSIKLGALEGLTNLKSLILNHNQIDVIEDHAFSSLFKLTTLDLSNNRIVAVSGSSLAHLTQLEDLNLAGNHLRALTADLISPLKSLRKLKLDDNEISIISSDALSENSTNLKKISLLDNPLNCDCSLQEFSTWLSSSSLSKNDKESAICATPPSLENGLLVEIPTENLICGQEEQDEKTLNTNAGVLKNKITLLNFQFNGEIVNLTWSIDDEGVPYKCDAIYVFEEQGLTEILIESTPFKCDSRNLHIPSLLEVTVPDSIDLLKLHKYRYCLVLIQNSKSENNDTSLIVGCSEVLPLVQNVEIVTPRIVGLSGNFSQDGTLQVSAEIFPSDENCKLEFAILDKSRLLTQKTVKCSVATATSYKFFGLAPKATYTACANFQKNERKCIKILHENLVLFSSLDIAMVSLIFIIFIAIIFVIFCWFRRVLKMKLLLNIHENRTHQYFVSTREIDEEHVVNRYVKLQQATSKV